MKIIDDTLLDKLYGFCYARTSDSYAAQDLCSDIIFALAGHSQPPEDGIGTEGCFMGVAK